MLSHLRQNKKGRDIKDILKSLFLWFLVLSILGFLGFTNFKIKQRRESLAKVAEALKKQIEEIELKNKDLEEKIAMADTKEYAEELARTQFNLKAEGEEVVVISRSESEKENNIPEPEKQEKTLWNNFKDFLFQFWQK